MKKLILVIIIIFILLPVNKSKEVTTVSENFPDKKDLAGFIFSFQKRIDELKFFQKANIMQEIVMETGKMEYAFNESVPLECALKSFYVAKGVEYKDGDINNFINKCNFSYKAENAIALLLFSYTDILNSYKFEEKIENIVYFFGVIRKTAGILKECKIEESIEDKYGEIIFGGIENNKHESFYSFIIDFGGDDFYHRRNNSFILDIGGNDKYEKQASFYGDNIVFDLSGNDTYNNFPFSENGINILFDLEGNDFYKGSVVTSHENGVSVLFDIEGNDFYFGGNYTQCYTNGGISILSDFKGDDIYNASSYSQACSEGGIAFMIDFYGDDAFFAKDFSQSFSRGLIKKSVAVLLNFEGDDYYNGGDFSQGYGEKFGFAVLFDFLGRDIYNAKQFSQASSMLGIAALIDSDGNNEFISSLFSNGYKMLGSSFFLNNFDFEDSYEIIEILDYLNTNLREILP
ncbi:MAG TPA: hypothetical protein ENI33_01665 [Thermoplasmatales archaeon]|nr:hypothetical protein [Thermoplasmatales archaeon]